MEKSKFYFNEETKELSYCVPFVENTKRQLSENYKKDCINDIQAFLWASIQMLEAMPLVNNYKVIQISKQGSSVIFENGSEFCYKDYIFILDLFNEIEELRKSGLYIDQSYEKILQVDTSKHLVTLMRCLVRFAATDEGSNINCTRIVDLLMH